MSDEPERQGGAPGWTPRDPTPVGPPAPAGRKRRTRPKRTGLRRLVPTWRMLLGTFLLFALLLCGGFAVGYLLVDIPSANATATAQSNVYLYEDGTQLARDGEINRENITLSQVPLTVRRAVLAAEDRDFYSERAIDPQAMIRAAWNTVTGKGRQSGSTITQQYVKNYYLGQEQTLTRKGKEFFIAIKLDREKSKDHILEGYLNTSYFGRSAYGIQAAAQAYYGKDIRDIDTAQGAYLASLLNAPSAYDVVVHPENKAAALARWNYVLDGMVKEGWLTAAERGGMRFAEPGRVRPASGLSGQRGYIVQAVKDHLTRNKIVDEDTLAAGGLRITTTVERKKQNALAKAVDDQVRSQLDKDRRKADRDVRVGGASIDPATGKVVALYGGFDYTKQYVSNATRRDYQVGSTFKPFVFTSAVENKATTQDGRRITPDTVYDGTSGREVQGRDGTVGYAPENEDRTSYGMITVRTATDQSVNSVYAQMAEDVGAGEVQQTAVDLGLPADTPELSGDPSIALGVATAGVLDMAEAYATLANHGRHNRYTLVEKLTRRGEPIDLPEQEQKQAVSREAADTTTAILRGVVESGTGTAAGAAGRPAAGKTGTAEEDQAAWFAGYTPDLATVVAVMGQDPDTAEHTSLYGALGLARINGGGPPARIWGQYTAAALDGTPVKGFDLVLAEGAAEFPPSPSPTTTTPEATPGASESPTAPPPSTAPAPTPTLSEGGTGTPTDSDTPTHGLPLPDGGTLGGGLVEGLNGPMSP
ncbi:transglycosylase domain-containing protein [Streptomyces sannanensis]|uniref:Transglycosylase domain-containing protein n=1 Tax=Streptomyces sannanensis TaxID=285536 RepID=A0ABP6SAP3_9ACTN